MRAGSTFRTADAGNVTSAFAPVSRRVASCAIFMAGVAVVTLRGKIRLVGEIWTGERLGMKSNVPGSKMVQVKGVMLLMQPTP